MKIYDKEIYERQQELRTILLIIIVFLIGFGVGYIAHSYSHSQNENTEKQYVNEQQLNVQV